MATSTDTKTAAATAAPPAEAPAAKLPAVSNRISMRLPFHPGVAQKFGLDHFAWKALVESVFPLAKTPNAIALALSYCRARKLDVFKKPIHIVPMWNNALRREVETVWPGIGELRTTAFRTRDYAGADATAFGDDVEMVFKDTWRPRNKPAKELTATVRFPSWAQITLYRMVQGQRVAFPGPRVTWLETYGTQRGTKVPNEKWARSPSYMLEKCAEAAALRKAFPEEIGEQQAAEEMEGRQIDTDMVEKIEAEARAAATAPQRQEFKAADRGTPDDGVQFADGEFEDGDEEDAEVEEERVDDGGDARTQQRDDRAAAADTAREQRKPDAQAPAPTTAKPVEEAAAAHGISGEGLSPPADDPRFKTTEEWQADAAREAAESAPSDAFKRAETMVDRLQESLENPDPKDGEMDLAQFKTAGRTAIDSMEGITDDERDVLRGRFATMIANEQRRRAARPKKAGK